MQPKVDVTRRTERGIMAHSHCTGPGTGPRTGPGTMGLYIMPLTVHTPPRLRTGQGTGPGTNGLHTHFPVPGSVQCV